MGINAIEAFLFGAILKKHGINVKSCLTMGRQDICFGTEELLSITREIGQAVSAAEILTSSHFSRSDRFVINTQDTTTANDFFGQLGIQVLESVDASIYENSSYVFDLNIIGLRNHIGKQFDLVFEAGTAEHIFHVPNYFSNLADVTKTGGLIVQILPVNNMVDHGFYQFSPTMPHDFYKANQFKLLELFMIFSKDEYFNNASWQPYIPGQYDTMSRRHFDNHYTSMLIVVRKTSSTTIDKIPQQRIYRQDVNWAIGLGKFTINETEEVATLAPPFIHCAGHCWKKKMVNVSCKSDNPDNPRQSKVVLLENNTLMGRAHSLHDDIRNTGGGMYSYWNDVLFFSTSDNSDPNENNREYKLRKLPG